MEPLVTIFIKNKPLLEPQGNMIFSKSQKNFVQDEPLKFISFNLLMKSELTVLIYCISICYFMAIQCMFSQSDSNGFVFRDRTRQKHALYSDVFTAADVVIGLRSLTRASRYYKYPSNRVKQRQTSRTFNRQSSIPVNALATTSHFATVYQQMFQPHKNVQQDCFLPLQEDVKFICYYNKTNSIVKLQ